ncbi:MAG: response regulator transcription factor [Chitinophagaceae bacterium]|nr:MAG: response regulator transcription factor [Chitinophagaceae bacterium]
MDAKVKLFIVDDHYMVIEGIHALLQQEAGVEWMGHATNAESCLAFMQSRQPDVLFMDISLPDQSGIDLCKRVKDLYPNIFILGLSTFNQQSFIQKMMENGASGYLLKNAGRAELMTAIATVMRGKTYLSHEAAIVMHQPPKQNGPVLTRRELEVLTLIAEGLTNNEIAAKLFIAATTVETHRKSLLTKFSAKNTATLVHKASQLQII